jgi:hypothetical protein
MAFRKQLEASKLHGEKTGKPYYAPSSLTFSISIELSRPAMPIRVTCIRPVMWPRSSQEKSNSGVVEGPSLRETRIYFAPFHAAIGDSSVSPCGSTMEVFRRAVSRQDWPYDGGDDPSFYAMRKFGGQLSWGVCRQDVRNSLRPNDHLRRVLNEVLAS